MRRCNSPFNGKQFVLNKNTGEIHDLDRETPQCQIDEIKPEHVFNCDTYTEAVIFCFHACCKQKRLCLLHA